MMKAGHSSGLGSNKNINVFLSFETDNLTVLEESSNIYHHFRKLHLDNGHSYIKQTILAYKENVH